jgi:two-component system chemotaxis response regulator CheB
VDGEVLQAGRIYVAPPDMHLVVDAEARLRLSSGPRANDHRPAIDPLFRSAAAALGSALAAVVLSGTLDDGAAGLAAVRRAGGIAVVQHPDDATFSAMPRAALAATTADLVGTATEIGMFIRSLGRSSATDATVPSARPEDGAGGPTNSGKGPQPVEGAFGRLTVFPAALDAVDLGRAPSVLACPDCRGVLWVPDDGVDTRRYRCRSGHSWTEDALVDRQAVELEKALWMALRLTDERLELFRMMRANDTEGQVPGRSGRWLDDRIGMLEHHSAMLHQILVDRAVDGGAADT